MLFFFSARRVNASSSGLSSTSRMILFSVFNLIPSAVLSLRLVEGFVRWILAMNHGRMVVLSNRIKRKVERCPVSHRTLGPDTASVPVHDALHGCESNPSSGELTSVVQPLKSSEQFVGISHIKSGPIVPHKVHFPIPTTAKAELD